MAFVSPEERLAVRRFNDRMITLNQRGKTNSEAYQNFAAGSETSRYRNIYRTDANGNLVLRTDFGHMSDAEIEQIERVMDQTLESGATTLPGLKKEYDDFMEEYGDDLDNAPTQEEYEKQKAQIDEESLHNVYYDEKNHQTTAAVENGLTKADALNMLTKLALKGKVSPYTGKIYPQSIRAALKSKYIE